MSSAFTMPKPCRSRCRRSAGRTASGSIPTTVRRSQRAHARDGMAFTGICGFALSAVRGHFAAGASAALMGIIGLLLAMNMKRGGALAQAQKSRLISWVAMTFMIGFFPGVRIDNWGHFGGLASGFILGRIIADRQPVTPREKQIAQALGWLAGLVLVTSFVLMFMHYRDPIPGE